MALLAVENLNKRFGGLKAVSDVSFYIRRGTIKSLIGPNGAGKTTLFNLISGFLRPDSGRVVFEGKPPDCRKGACAHVPAHQTLCQDDGTGKRHDREAFT